MAWPCLIGVIILQGCGGPGYNTVRLEGRFRIAGQPVEKGGITFTPMTASRGNGVYVPVTDGYYVAKDVPVGKSRVTFIALEATGREVTVMGKTSPEMRLAVPLRYRGGMEIDVGVEDRERDFDLEEN